MIQEYENRGQRGKKRAPAALYVLVALSLVATASLPGCAGRGQTRNAEIHPVSKPAPGLAAAPFFPLAIGNTWKYAGSHLGEDWEKKIEIVDREGAWYIDNQGERFLVDAEGLRGPTRYLLRAPIVPGEEWSAVVSLSHTEYYAITEIDVTATVPAGRFHGCVRVTGRLRVEPTANLFQTSTYCPGVGLVQVRSWIDAAGRGRIPQARMDLLEYRLAES